MALALALLVVLILVALLSAGLYRFRSVRRYRRCRVVIHTKAGESIAGVLTGSWIDCFVLEDAVYLAEKADLKGQALVLKSEVNWLQVLGPGDEAAT